METNTSPSSASWTLFFTSIFYHPGPTLNLENGAVKIRDGICKNGENLLPWYNPYLGYEFNVLGYDLVIFLQQS